MLLALPPLALGWVFVALGFIGALLPVMPTTIFLIVAAGCFARGSPRLEAWLRAQRTVVAPIVNVYAVSHVDELVQGIGARLSRAHLAEIARAAQ